MYHTVRLSGGGLLTTLRTKRLMESRCGLVDKILKAQSGRYFPGCGAHDVEFCSIQDAKQSACHSAACLARAEVIR